MNPLVLQVLQDARYAERIRRKLPPAFESVEPLARGPEIGVLREPIIVAMFMAFLGQDVVRPVNRKVFPDVDCFIGDLPLSIKTVSRGGGIRLKWTTTPFPVQRWMEEYQPEFDLLIVRIWWGREGYIRYIPVEIQSEVYRQLSPRVYLDYRGATNTRGVNLSKTAEKTLADHPQTFTLPVLWERTASPRSPYQQWLQYWKEP